MSVRHNEAAHRFELDAPHGLAIAVYRPQGDARVFTHTEVPPQDEARLPRDLCAQVSDAHEGEGLNRPGLQLRRRLRAAGTRNTSSGVLAVVGRDRGQGGSGRSPGKVDDRDCR